MSRKSQKVPDMVNKGGEENNSSASDLDLTLNLDDGPVDTLHKPKPAQHVDTINSPSQDDSLGLDSFSFGDDYELHLGSGSPVKVKKGNKTPVDEQPSLLQDAEVSSAQFELSDVQVPVLTADEEEAEATHETNSNESDESKTFGQSRNKGMLPGLQAAIERESLSHMKSETMDDKDIRGINVPKPNEWDKVPDNDRGKDLAVGLLQYIVQMQQSENQVQKTEQDYKSDTDQEQSPKGNDLHTSNHDSLSTSLDSTRKTDNVALSASFSPVSTPYSSGELDIQSLDEQPRTLLAKSHAEVSEFFDTVISQEVLKNARARPSAGDERSAIYYESLNKIECAASHLFESGSFPSHITQESLCRLLVTPNIIESTQSALQEPLLIRAAGLGCTEVVMLLLKLGVSPLDPHQFTRSGSSALSAACIAGQPHIALALLGAPKGLVSNSATEKEMTEWASSSSKYRDRVIKLLTMKDEFGWTPLHDAAHQGQIACLRVLISAAAQVVDNSTAREITMTRNSVKRSPLELAIYKSCKVGLEALQAYKDVGLLTSKEIDELVKSPLIDKPVNLPIKRMLESIV